MTYLFRCVLGGGHDVSVWAYVLVTEREEHDLDLAAGEELDALLDTLFAVNNVEVAVAEDDRGIVFEALL